MNRFVVVKSLTRNYGYSIQAPPDITWVNGTQRTFGWYRYKADAQKRADELNLDYCGSTNCTLNI